MNGKKAVAIMLVMMLVGAVCLFADEKSNTVDTVYITWQKTGYQSPTVTKKQMSYPVEVYYTIYYEDGGKSSHRIIMARDNLGGPISFYSDKTIKTIVVTEVKRLR
jgi:uncharacterized protein YxeA